MKKLLLLLLVLAVPVVRAQTPLNVQKGGAAGTNNITSDLNIGSGRTFTIGAGGTFVLNGSFSPGAGTIAWSALTGQPTTIAGYGITDGVSTGGSYADPSWITSLGAGKLTGTVSAGRLPAFSGDLTTPGGSTVTTLTTVNANTGTWGDATHSPTFTVNGKGLVIGASQSSLQVASTGISDSTATGRALITASNPASARSTLVLATVANTGSYNDLSNQPTFNTLSPMTTLGDTIYGAASGAGTRLPGNTTTARQFLRQTGTGSVSAAPAWDTLVNADIPSALSGKTYNGLTATALATGFSIAGGTTSKVLTVPLDATISGTNTGDQTITLTGDATGSGTSAVAVTLGTVNSNVGSFGSGTLVSTFTVDGKGRITAAGNATSTPVFANITSKPTSAAGYGITNGAAIDTWGTKTPPVGAVVGTSDAQALTGKTVNGLNITTTTGTLAIANGKTLTASNSLTFAGADSSTLNIGAGGTLGTAAFTAASAYEVPLTFTTGLTRTVNTVTVNPSQSITTLSNLTSNGFVKTSGGIGTLGVVGTVNLATEGSGILPGANGGTGNGFTAFSGPASTLKTFALPNASANILTDNTAVTVGQGGTGNTTLTGYLIGNGTSAVTGAAIGQLPGTATNDDATAGNVGEYLVSDVLLSGALSLSAGTAKTITSISLTAGDWDVTGQVQFNPDTTTITGIKIAAVNSTTNTLPNSDFFMSTEESITSINGAHTFVNCPMVRISVATTTVYYLIGYAEFSVSTETANGRIRARRVR